MVRSRVFVRSVLYRRRIGHGESSETHREPPIPLICGIGLAASPRLAPSLREWRAIFGFWVNLVRLTLIPFLPNNHYPYVVRICL
jgi:hypothetical protein